MKCRRVFGQPKSGHPLISLHSHPAEDVRELHCHCSHPVTSRELPVPSSVGSPREGLTLDALHASVPVTVRKETLTESVRVSLWALVGVILIATTLCFGMTDLSASQIKALPVFLAIPYQWGGPEGVAIAVISLGLAVIGIGLSGEFLTNAIRGRRNPAKPTNSEVDLFSNPPPGAGSSFMQLETSRYLSGWSAPAVEPACEVEAECEEEAECEVEHACE
jgi:hypothetical protein